MSSKIICDTKIEKKENPTCSREIEKKLIEDGSSILVGCDGVGNGCYAGPIVICACHIPLDVQIKGVNDSKKLTEKQREKLFEQLTNEPRIKYAIVRIEPAEIDEINILQAEFKGMKDATNELSKLINIDTVLVDGNKIPPNFPQHLKVQSVVHGDAVCYPIGAASIIAKVTRDRLMKEYDKIYPGYGFAKNKGYPTPQHKKTIKTLGVTPIHRKTFKGVCSD